MAKIKQKLDFSESVFIEKQVINNISYNSSISSFTRSKVVIENFLTKEIREIRKSEQDCFNPKPNYKGVFSIIDHSKYNVYFIDSSIANGKIGGSLLIDNEKKENIYYYADFSSVLMLKLCIITTFISFVQNKRNKSFCKITYIIPSIIVVLLYFMFWLLNI